LVNANFFDALGMKRIVLLDFVLQQGEGPADAIVAGAIATSALAAIRLKKRRVRGLGGAAGSARCRPALKVSRFFGTLAQKLRSRGVAPRLREHTPSPPPPLPPVDFSSRAGAVYMPVFASKLTN
jgi:hypothetical protein